MKVQRREATDALRREGEMAVLIDGSLVRLSALSALIWELTDEPMDIERLARALEERFGAPQGGSSLDATKDAVAELVHHGVLRQSG